MNNCLFCHCEISKQRKYCSLSCCRKHINPMDRVDVKEKHHKKILELRQNKDINKKISKTLKRKNASGEIVHPWKGKKIEKVTGKNNPMWGKKRPDLVKRNKENPLNGDKNPAWMGGLSFYPYTPEFNNKLKGFIRKRDNYTCQECGYSENILGYKLSIHHIDYDKTNNNENNLISLCKSCHGQTCFNRADWTKYYAEKVMDNSK